MLCKDIICVIEHTYPKQAALEWDNVGLLAGRTGKEVKKIYVALDATDEVIEDAIAKEVDMLVTHHPLIFSPLKTITDECFISSRVVKLLQHDISYYAMHTNYDVLAMARLSAELMGLQDTEVLEVTNEDKKEGIGRVGDFESSITLQECGQMVKERFELETVKIFGDMEKKVKRIAISPGSGKHMSELALSKKADVFITGDIDHHEGIDAMARGMAIIDAGHYGLEHIFVDNVANYLTENIEGVEIEKAKKSHPFQVI